MRTTASAPLFWVGVLGLALLAPGPACAAAPRAVDYLYVEANEGGSSGGHVAFRFGEWTFHFQQHASGLIRLHRDDSAVFHHVYAMLGNRTIRESRIAVSDETYDLLRAAFTRRHVVETAHFETFDNLRRDVALFEDLAAHLDAAATLSGSLSRMGEGKGEGELIGHRRQPLGQSVDESDLRKPRWASPDQSHPPHPGLLPSGRRNQTPVRALPALGYFLPDGAAPPSAGASPALQQLREQITATHGAAFLDTRIAEVRRDLREMPVHAASPGVSTIAADEYPTAAPSDVALWEDRTIGLFGLQLLRAAAPLRAGAYIIPNGEELALGPRERRRLRQFRARLERDVAALATSSRSDWGFPLAVGLARLAAIDLSLRLGRLVVLASAAPEEGDARRMPEAVGAGIEAEVRADLAEARAVFVEAEHPHEADYTAVEVAAQRLSTVRTAVAQHTWPDLRTASVLPALPARRTDLEWPSLSRAEAAAQLGAARAREREYVAALRRLYPYDLVTRNCVSELFAVVDRTLAADESRRLGGVVSMRRTLNFIPFRSAAAVDAHYRVTAHRERPSYREQRLAEMYRDEPDLLVALRESNTLTSTVYLPAARDSPFLFFTDDALLARPLLGAANLTVALADSALGLLTAPFDRATRLRKAINGALFSLPELAFVNIRKGSLAFVPRPTAAAASASPNF